MASTRLRAVYNALRPSSAQTIFPTSLTTRPMSSSTAFPNLSSSLQLGDLTLRNRNVMASLTRNRSVPTNVPNDTNKEYYTQRAAGGCGLILAEGTLISQQGTEWPHAPGIWSEEQVVGWKNVNDSVHAAGGLIFCQLWHVGRVAHPDMPEQKRAGKPVPGPSAISARGGKFRDLPGKPGYVTPTEIEDPWTIIEEFRHAAKQAKRAGFDGVELHSANGYLVHQFLDWNSNQRTDQWGGSVENRTRFGLEALKALIDVWGPARVGIKLSPCAGYNDVGMPLPDTLITFSHYLAEICALKPAYVQLVRYAPAMDQPTATQQDEGEGDQPSRGTPHDVLASYGAIVKPPPDLLKKHPEAQLRGRALPERGSAADKANPSPTRLFFNGGLSPQEADQLIKDGKIDAAVFGTLWIGNPDLQRRIEAGLDVGGKGINEQPNVKAFYQSPEGKPELGYSDYSTA